MAIKFDSSKDKIAIIAPASGLTSAISESDKMQLRQTLDDYIQYTENLFDIHSINAVKIYGYDDILKGADLPYLSSNLKSRVSNLKAALADKDVRIIFALRGGYGSAEVINDIYDPENVNINGQKLLLGFSDITTVHMLLNFNYATASVHMHNLHNLYLNQQFIDENFNCLKKSEAIKIDFEPLNTCAKGLNAEAEIVGGNLSVFCFNIGSKIKINLKDKFLFLEDVGEKGYYIHRALLQIYNAGLFKDIKGVIFGDFTNSDDLLECSINSFIKEYLSHAACIKVNDIGHGQLNKPLMLGQKVKFKNNQIIFNSPIEFI